MSENESPRIETEREKLLALFDELESIFRSVSSDSFFQSLSFYQDLKDKFETYVRFLRSEMELDQKERSLVVESAANLLFHYVDELHYSLMEENDEKIRTAITVLRIFLDQRMNLYKNHVYQ
jgi:hypothetical protein